ncbi:MAG: type II secretion system protein [Patescibacteria group bacterium]|nr:type II secretion system protein [Patescibacteria group bacterium]MDE2172382.1 type II secretion system protein [Patescibacteria group bacterium]
MIARSSPRGFTVIELLVVIAIIALLSAVVLVSLNVSRNRGKDTRVMNDVQQIRTDIESSFNGTDYSAAITADNSTETNGDGIIVTAGSVGKQLTDDAAANGGVVFAITTATGPFKYAVYGQMISDTSKYFCMGSDGSTNKWTSTVDTVAQVTSNTPICQ